MPFYKKTIPIHTSKKEKTSGESEPNNSEDVQTNLDNNSESDNYNPNTVFRKGFSLFGNSIVSSAKKVQTSFGDRKDFLGKASLREHLWLETYYQKFKKDSGFAIKEIISDGDGLAIIQIATGEVKEYDTRNGIFLPGASQWLPDEDKYTPKKPAEEKPASKNKQAESSVKGPEYLVLVPRYCRLKRTINEPKEGSDNSDERQ